MYNRVRRSSYILLISEVSVSKAKLMYILQWVVGVILFLLLISFMNGLTHEVNFMKYGKWSLGILVSLAILYGLYRGAVAANWQTVGKHKGMIGKVLMTLVVIVLVVWGVGKINDYWTTMRYERTYAEAVRHEAYCATNPLENTCYTGPIFVTATVNGSKSVNIPLGKAYELGPTTIASYAVRYEMLDGRSEVLERPKDSAHKNLPYPLKSLTFISRETTPVTIVLRLK